MIIPAKWAELEAVHRANKEDPAIGFCKVMKKQGLHQKDVFL
jgi:hypothetical protein